MPSGLYNSDGTVIIPWSQLISEDYLTFTDGVLGYGENEALLDMAGEMYIDSSVTEIGESCFMQCSLLTKVVLPSSVKVIGDSAFYGCSALASIDLPNGLTTIGPYAFQLCNALTSFHIPNTVTSVGAGALKECEALADVVVSSAMTGIPDEFVRQSEKIVNFTIPANITTIGAKAFMQTGLSGHIVVPETVTSIGEGAYSYCPAITSITLPSGLTELSKSLLQWDTGLLSVEIPSGVTSIGMQCFNHCEALEAIDLPSGVTSIGRWSFARCNSIHRITLPGGITAIPQQAFLESTALAKIDFSSFTAIPTLENINAFNGLPAGAKIVVPADLYSTWKAASVWANVTGAEIVAAAKRISVDMSTLAGWANIAAGSHTLTVKAKADGYTTSDASTGVTFTKQAAQYTVSLSADYLTLSDFGPAVEGQDFTTVLCPREGYSAPAKSAVSVKIGGTVYTGFTYNQATDGTGAATLTIPGSAVLGNILITANGVARSKWTISIVPQNAEDGWYVTTERYVQGVLTTVHLNDGDHMYTGEKLTYYAEAKPGYETTSGKTVVSGDVVASSDITVTFKFPNNVSYPVSVNVTHLTFSGASMATHGTNYTATITPASGYTLPSTVAVTIGGNSYTGFTWNKSTGVLTIPGADIIGTIIITAAGVESQGGYTLTVTAFRGSFNITYADGSTADVEDGVYSNVKQINSYVFEAESDRSWNINGSQPALPYALTADSTAYVYSACIIEGTLVTLADGTAKPIENITYDDDLLVWNFYEGEFGHAKPIWIKPAGVVPEYNLCKFDNGAEIGLVGPGIYHRIYNNEAHEFTHTGSEDTPIGTTTFTDYGDFTKLVSQKIVHKTVRYYNVVTDKHYNIFANGILTSSRISNRYGIEDGMRYNLNDVRMTEEEVEDYIAKLPR